MALITLFVLTATIGTGLVFWLGCLSYWWILPVWVGFYVASIILYILWLFPAVLLTPNTDTPSKKAIRFYRWCEHKTLRWLLSQLVVRYSVKGAEKIPGDQAFLLVCNHRSAFDPIVTIATLTKCDLCFVGKPEVFKIPVVGAAMKRVGFFPIDRENPRNAVTAIKHGAELISQQGRSVGIYPEGTRCRTEEMLPFHAGSFKIAKLANCPVVVTSIRYEKRWLFPGFKRAQLHVVDVMDVDFVKENNPNTLAERAQEAIKKDLEM